MATPTPVTSVSNVPVGENARHEYADISANLRFHRAIEFAQLVLFILVNLVIVALIWKQSSTLSSRTERMLKSAAALSALFFWVGEERLNGLFSSLMERATALEKHLGYRQFSVAPKSAILNTANASRLLALAVFAFWMAQLFLPY